MKIQEGKRYVRRDGSVTKPLTMICKNYFEDEETGFFYMSDDGSVFGEEEKDPKDLVKEYIEPKWQEKIWFTEIDYIKPNKMENPTKEQVLKAAEKSQEVKEALMELYPEAFEDELEVGDLVMINGDVCIIGRCGFDELVPISINDGRYHTMTFSDVGSISDRLKEITHGSSIITKLNKSDYINVDKL